METTPCDIHEYDSDEYNFCIKDIVYEQAQDEWNKAKKEFQAASPAIFIR